MNIILNNLLDLFVEESEKMMDEGLLIGRFDRFGISNDGVFDKFYDRQKFTRIYLYILLRIL